jgi:hypothetical protein
MQVSSLHVEVLVEVKMNKLSEMLKGRVGLEQKQLRKQEGGLRG